MMHPSGDPDLPVGLLVKDGGKNKLVLPEAAAHIVLSQDHRMTGHGGVDKTWAAVKDVLCKPGLAQDIVDSCIPCKQCKKPNLHEGEDVPLMSAQSPEEMVYMDLMAVSVPGNEGEKYIVSLIDGFTRYIQLHPVQDKKTSTVTKGLLDH